MQGSNSSEARFVNDPDSNLSGGPNQLSMQKPDSQYIQQINKPMCKKNDILVQDNTNNTYEEDNMYCYNNGTKGDNKKLVQWKKVDGLWIGRHLTNSSEYKEINNQVCKVITPGCDSMNPSQDCQVKCFADDKSSNVYTANYVFLPN
jgi:hypothetical protein